MRHKDRTDLRVGRSSAGLGLFAKKPFTRGEHIVEYTGEHLTEEEADAQGGKYLFEVSDELVIDGSGRENLARYANHSCKPNAYAEIDEDTEEVHLFAKRKIKPGEEITYNYGKSYFEEHIQPYGCRCASCLA